MTIHRFSAVITTTVLLLSSVLLSSHAQTIRINVGSNKDYVDQDGNKWEADSSKFRPKNGPQTMAWETKSQERIANTQDDGLYQTERFGRGGNLKYSIPVPVPGDYRVRLYYAENFKQVQGPNQRVFHIVSEGKLEIANVDIYEMARNEGFRATSQAFRTVVSGDTLDLEFIKVKQNPKVNAIEIQKWPTDTSLIPIHPDITAILDVAKGDERPLGLPWADSYSIGDRCYCMTTYDHNIDIVQADTAAGYMTVKEACEIIGPGPGYKEGYPIYNTIQCGHGPLNNAGDEHLCPGRVDFGFDGCGHIGPKWKFEEED